MTDKENLQQETEKNTSSKASDSEATSPVLNPFEESTKALSKEELENIEQFKEAQTERD